MRADCAPPLLLSLPAQATSAAHSPSTQRGATARPRRDARIALGLKQNGARTPDQQHRIPGQHRFPIAYHEFARMTSSGMEGERKRVIKSLKYHKAAVDRFLPAFLRALAPVDPTQSRALLKRLSTMVQEGEAPSFAGPSSLSRRCLLARPSCPCCALADFLSCAVCVRAVSVRRSGSSVRLHPETHGAPIGSNE
jgi:hypothetical protein